MFGGVVRLGVWYVWGCGMFGGVLFLGVWYVWGCVIFGGVVFWVDNSTLCDCLAFMWSGVGGALIPHRISFVLAKRTPHFV